jgi:uncharacterized repeat protein (TIGR03803 family)
MKTLSAKAKICGLTIVKLLVLLLASVNLAAAQTVQFTTLAFFDKTNGSLPKAELTLGNDGCFYGTTIQVSESPTNYGTIFKVATNGQLTSLYYFDNTNGSVPTSKLILSKDGNFYGTTASGGTNGYGTIFKFSTNGTLKQLYAFQGGNSAVPHGLTIGNDGSLYGTTMGANFSYYGAAYKFTTNGTFSTLASFDVNSQFPVAMSLMPDGILYGICAGAFNSTHYGTVFKMTTNGTLTTLASLSPFYGSNPDAYATPTLAPDGNLYGETKYFGNNSSSPGYGTIYRVTTNGTMSLIYVFTNPPNTTFSHSLTVGNDGNLYGVTEKNTNAGTIFQLTTNGTFSILFSFGFAFTNQSGLYTNVLGAFPNSLNLGNDGSFYGTTQQGGTNGYGTVFKLTILPPSPIPLNFQTLPGLTILSWTNSTFALQAAPEVTGTFTNIPNATSPYTNATSDSRNYFRLIAN